MDDRALAISILKRARDILAARLAERVIQSGEEIIEDALGNSYSSEIETIHDEVGLRLTHVNAMLASLPTTTADHPPSSPQGDFDRPTAGEAIPVGELPAPLEDQQSAAESRPANAPQAQAPGETVSFQAFVAQVTSGDIDAAGRSLAVLLDVAPDRGRRCAETFAERLTTQPDFLAKAMRLRGELQNGSINGALVMLWECFGLRGFESIGAWQSLKSRLVNPVSVREETMTDER